MDVQSMQLQTRRTSGVAIAALMPHAPVLVPAVGGEDSAVVASTVRGMYEASRRVVAAEADVLVLVSPHSPREPGAFGIWSGPRFYGSLAQFGAPGAAVSLPADTALAEAIVAAAKSRRVATWSIEAEPLDHGAVVPLWFLVAAGWRGPTVLTSLNYPGEGGLCEFGAAIAAAAVKTGRRIAVVASGDMSHRLRPGAPGGFSPRAGDFDREFLARLQRGAYRELPGLDAELQLLAGQDALDSTLVAIAAAHWDAAHHEVLSYEGPFGVGYGVAVLFAAD